MPSPRSSARSTGAGCARPTGSACPISRPRRSTGGRSSSSFPRFCSCSSPRTPVHIKAVAIMTERDLDPMIGRAFMGDGLATSISGLFGGSGTTTYAENIGVMGFTRVYSTLAYVIAGCVAIALGLLPKFGAIISAIPVGVVRGAVTLRFGMIAVLGARIWIEAAVNFRDPVNLVTAAVALIVGAGNYTLNWGDYQFAGIALGTIAAIVIYQVLRFLQPRDARPRDSLGDPLVEPLAHTEVHR